MFIGRCFGSWGGGLKKIFVTLYHHLPERTEKKHAKLPLYSMLLPIKTHRSYTAKFFGFKQQISVTPDKATLTL